MRKQREVSYKDLKYTCDPEIFDFETTADLDSNYQGIGQKRGIESLQFGLSIDTSGYNVYVEGPGGSGKTTYTKEFLNSISKSKKAPQDWVYVYNFDVPNEPIAINLPAGEGVVFQTTMENFIKDIRNDIKSTFRNKDFEKEKQIINNQYQEVKSKLLEDLNAKSAKYGFQVKSSEGGIYMMPVMNGEVIKEEDFDKLDEDIKAEYEEKSSLVQNQIIQVITKLKELDEEADKKIAEWQSNIVLLTIEGRVSYVKSQYKRNKKINNYMDGIKKDILKNIDKFSGEEKEPKKQIDMRMPEEPPWEKYKVNLFVDNSKLDGAPVIQESNYSFTNLFGRLEYENHYGILKTDYMMLRPGLLHRANGGYIMFQVRDLLANPECYENLKKVLRNRELGIDNTNEQRAQTVLIGLKPEPIPLDLKVILIGDENVYQTLLAIDEEFRKLFKIKVEFEEETELNQENLIDIARFVHGFCEEKKFPHLDRDAVARLCEYSSKMADNQHKLSTQFGEMTQVIVEAATWAKLDKEKNITRKYIDKALHERKMRGIKYDEKYSEMIKNKVLLIDTDGSKVGQINGLTVMTIGDYSFGKPVRITANTFTGKRGIIDIEREVEHSGSAHSKGVLILNGYLGETFAKNMPLSLTGSICFEQMYNEIDGDSASSTELYALLSSLANIPINQGIAVTGSVNQKGEIQSIGGVNEKIEGFFEVCKNNGLTGYQGVIIPEKNVQNLNLNDEVIEAVKNREFHIYAVSNIEEGIEILTGVPAGNINIPGTINYLAYNTLKRFAKASKDMS